MSLISLNKSEFTDGYNPHTDAKYIPQFNRTVKEVEKERYNPIGNAQNNIPYQLYQQTKKVKQSDKFSRQALSGIQCASELSDLFFGNKNTNYIQELIRYNVYQKTNGKYIIGKQSEVDLQIIMRSIFLQYGQNIEKGVNVQVKELDKLVVEECVPRIVSEIEMHYAYLKRSSNQDYANQLARPINDNNAGRKTLPGASSKFLF